MFNDLRVRSFLINAMSLCLIFSSKPATPMAAPAQDEVISSAEAAIKPLKDLDFLAVGGINEAISKGDDALKRRLEQLHAIVQEALATIDQILKTRIDQLDQATRNRLDQTIRGAVSLATKFSADYQQGIRVADDALRHRIEQFQNQVGNVVAALPINFDPLVNIDLDNGLTTVRERGAADTSALMKKSSLSGCGMAASPSPSSVVFDNVCLYGIHCPPHEEN